MRVSRLSSSLMMAGVLVCLVGCGTNFDEVLFRAADASGRTLLDIFLTDLENTLADAADQASMPPPAEGQTDGSGSDTTPVNDTPIEQLTGDSATGEDLFVSNNCSACHCADATGGCALDAPSLVGVAVDELDARVRGEANHPGGKFNFSNQDIVDLQAFLANLGGG